MKRQCAWAPCWSALPCSVRGPYPALFSPATDTMQLFMWQRDIVGVAHYNMNYFEVLGALDDAQPLRT